MSDADTFSRDDIVAEMWHEMLNLMLMTRKRWLLEHESALACMRLSSLPGAAVAVDESFARVRAFDDIMKEIHRVMGRLEEFMPSMAEGVSEEG